MNASCPAAVESSIMSFESWAELQRRKQKQLTDAYRSPTVRSKQKANAVSLLTVEEAVQVVDFETFDAVSTSLCEQQQQRAVSKLINKKLSPYFRYLVSFDDALKAASTANRDVSLVWGALLLILQVSNQPLQSCIPTASPAKSISAMRYTHTSSVS